MTQDKSNAKKKNALKKTLVLYTMNEIQGIKSMFDKIPINIFDQFFPRQVSFEDKHVSECFGAL